MNAQHFSHAVAGPLAALLFLVAGGCDAPQPPVETIDLTRTGEAGPELFRPDRPAADAAHDAARQPEEVIAFAGIKPGMRIIDVIAGDGYYTELLAQAVGPSGYVLAFNPPGPMRMETSMAAWRDRLAGGRLPNVKRWNIEFSEWEPQEASFDMAFMYRDFHRFYLADEEAGWPRPEVDAVLAKIYRTVRPGGTAVVIDNIGENAPPEETARLGRIDPDVIVTAMEGAGFRLESDADILHRPDDDHASAITRATPQDGIDRVVLRFRKPA